MKHHMLREFGSLTSLKISQESRISLGISKKKRFVIAFLSKKHFEISIFGQHIWIWSTSRPSGEAFSKITRNIVKTLWNRVFVEKAL